MKVSVFIVFLIVLFSCQSGQKADYDSFGDVISKEGTTRLENITGRLSVGDSIPTKLVATIDQVCQMKGCWMTLKTSDSSAVRVTFKDYGFFVPKDAGGKEVIIEGTATLKKLDRATAEHYAEDAGKVLEADTDLTELSVVATGVLIKKGSNP